MTNTGDCALLNVSLVDDNATAGDTSDDVIITLEGLTDEDGDGEFDDLAAGASATGSADYTIPEGLDPVENTATAQGENAQGIVVSDTASWRVDIVEGE